MGDEYSEITYDVDDPVATIRLNRPERLNALTHRMLEEIRRAVDAAADDPAVVGIVITGNGRGFCAGLDAQVLEATAGAGSRNRASDPASQDDVPGLFTYLLSVPKPVVAAVNGAAAGGGLVLAMLCDVRFASPDAFFKASFPERGLIAEHGTSWVVPRLVGPGRALDLLWSPRRFGAEDAYRSGMVEHLVAEGDVCAAAQDYVRELAAAVSPASLADTKELVYRHLGVGYPEALREADDYQWAALDRDDSTEGARSFLERRPPTFARVTRSERSSA